MSAVVADSDVSQKITEWLNWDKASNSTKKLKIPKSH